MSKFKKGVSGNPQGRPRGTKNRTTEELRGALLRLLDDNIEDVQQQLNSMKGKDKLGFILGLVRHLIPAATVFQKIDLGVELDRLSDEDITRLVDEITKKQYGYDEKK